MKRRLLLFFLLFSSLVTAQNNIYRSGGITQTVGAPTFVPGASGNIVAIDTVTGEWYVNPNRLSGASWISAGYRLTNISGSVPPAYTPTAHQSHFVVNAANELYYWDGFAWQSVGGGGSTDALRLKFIVVNKSGGTLNKGEVVYVSGAQGNRVAVKKALASADSLSANTLGVMDETVADNGEGYCVAEGLVSGINTSAFTEGAALYLSPTTAGGITQTKTTAPDHLVLIGYCVKSNAGSGEISVHIQNGYELGELHDVYVPSPTNGQVLTYNTTNARWEAATVADQSATNEIQTIDTFSLSGQTLSASLSLDNQPAKTVTLPIVDVVAGTNVTVTKSNGVATVSATGGGGGSGTVTGTGVAGRAAFWRSTSAISSDANFGWDSTNVQLNIGAPSSPTGRLNVRGGGTLTTVNLRLTNSGNTELLKVLDNGNTNIGTGFNWDNANNRLGIGTASPAVNLDVVGRMNLGGNFTLTTNTAFSVLGSQSNRRIINGTAAVINQQAGYLSGIVDFDGAQGFSNAAALNFTCNNRNTGSGNVIGAGRFTFTNDLSTSALQEGYGVLSRILNNSTVTAGSMRLFYADYLNQVAGSTVTDLYLIDANLRTNLGTITNTYAVFVGDITKGTQTNTPYSFYASDADSRNYFAGNTSIGVTVPSARLHVQGGNNTSNTYSLIVTNSGGSTTTPAICAQNDQKVGIGTNSVDSGATLEVDGTSGGILFPRLTTTQRDALTPTNGLVIYNSTTDKLQVRAGGAWVDLH